MSTVREWKFVDAEALRAKLAAMAQPDPVLADSLAAYDRLNAGGEWAELVLDGSALMVMTFSTVTGEPLCRGLEEKT